MKTTVVINKCILYTVHDGMQSCGIKFCTFCRIWCYHFCCSPTKRGAPRSDVWKAESPTKRLCLPRSLNALGRLLKGQPPSWVHTGLTASLMKTGQVSTARPPATKSPFLLMTDQNTTSPSLHHQNQPPDSGSEHESQRRQLRLSLHRSHRHACCVCFCLECFTISEERRGEVSVSTARPPATKSPFLLMTNQNKKSPAPQHQNQPPDFGSVHESQQQQLRLSLHRSHRHTCCVRVRRVFYNFPWREAAQLMCLAALRFS